MDKLETMFKGEEEKQDTDKIDSAKDLNDLKNKVKSYIDNFNAESLPFWARYSVGLIIDWDKCKKIYAEGMDIYVKKCGQGIINGWKVRDIVLLLVFRSFFIISPLNHAS